MNRDTLIGIGLGIITICIIIGVTLLVLSQFTPSTFCENYCNQLKGKFWIATDCNGSVLACSGFCELSNKTIYCEDLLKNITNMEV